MTWLDDIIKRISGDELQIIHDSDVLIHDTVSRIPKEHVVSVRYLFYDVNYQLAETIVQFPNLDLRDTFVKRKGKSLTDFEMRRLNRRTKTTKYWLENYVTKGDQFYSRESLPSSAKNLTITQKAFLHKLANVFQSIPWEESAIQKSIFDVARLTPIEQQGGLQAIYRVLLDRDTGPTVGNYVCSLKKDLVVKKFKGLAYSKPLFWREAGITDEIFEEWLRQEKVRITEIKSRLDLLAVEVKSSDEDFVQQAMVGTGVIEFFVTMNDKKTYIKRVIFDEFEGIDSSVEKEVEHFEVYATEYIEELTRDFELDIGLSPA